MSSHNNFPPLCLGCGQFNCETEAGECEEFSAKEQQETYDWTWS
jgi:hypothetical protein